jgi:predicted nucleic acid-binding protein
VSGGVFLDTGIFIAALIQSDRYHAQAVELFGRSGTRWATSVPVFSECHSWFLHRHGEESARNLRAFVAALKGLKLYEATLEDHNRALRMLDRYRGSKLTYVDASSLAWIEHQKIKIVWSTDHHLGLTGAEIVPRSI